MHKKIIIILIFIFIFIFILLFVGLFIILRKNKFNNKSNLYINQIQEVNEDEIRKTIYKVYYYNEEKNELESENRVIDVKEFIKDPYLILLNGLLEEPRNNKIKKLIPLNTKINKVYLNNDILVIDFSKEFIINQNNNDKFEKNTIYSIVKTVTQLNEVNGIKILIDGIENQGFADKYISFDVIFTKDACKL